MKEDGRCILKYSIYSLSVIFLAVFLSRLFSRPFNSVFSHLLSPLFSDLLDISLIQFPIYIDPAPYLGRSLTFLFTILQAPLSTTHYLHLHPHAYSFHARYTPPCNLLATRLLPLLLTLSNQPRGLSDPSASGFPTLSSLSLLVCSPTVCHGHSHISYNPRA
jgi:hypothetical protein